MCFNIIILDFFLKFLDRKDESGGSSSRQSCGPIQEQVEDEEEQQHQRELLRRRISLQPGGGGGSTDMAFARQLSSPKKFVAYEKQGNFGHPTYPGNGWDPAGVSFVVQV